MTGPELADEFISDLARNRGEKTTGSFGYAQDMFREQLGKLEPTADPGATFRASLERMDGSNGARWMRSWIDEGKLSAAEVKMLTEGGELRSLLARLDAPLVDRVTLMQSFGVAPGEISHAYKAQQIVHQDIIGFLSDPQPGQDWLYDFRNGTVSAKLVFDAALEACPDPGSGMNEFRSRMFRHLAEEDLARAMEVLDGMSVQEKDWHKAFAARWWFTGVDPNDFLKLTSLIDYGNDPKMRQFLSECWGDKSGPEVGLESAIEAVLAGSWDDDTVSFLQSQVLLDRCEDVWRLIEKDRFGPLGGSVLLNAWAAVLGAKDPGAFAGYLPESRGEPSRAGSSPRISGMSGKPGCW